MSKAIARLLDLAEEEERELRFHLGVIGDRRRELAALQNGWRSAVDDAATQLGIHDHEQFHRHAMATEFRCQQAESQRTQLGHTEEQVREELLRVHQRQRSYALLQEREAARRRKVERRREQRAAEACALRRWREDQA